MTLRASNQVLCNVWSYDFYYTTLATEQQRRHMIKCITKLSKCPIRKIYVPFFLREACDIINLCWKNLNLRQSLYPQICVKFH